MKQAIALVEHAFEHGNGGEIIVPKLPSVRMIDMAQAIGGKRVRLKVTGVRPGEKIHEALIGRNEPSFDCGSHYIISDGGTTGFEYASDTNRAFLDHKGINEILAQNVAS